ncbi:hypothetical protein [Pseudoalteromonas sp. DL-6]|uniref:hypothetical protein n=1 Tax=Pseudoalteromonas sp. DL-6 TaxID=1390185 RepID=UPI00103D5889|nr:hypothetical protein [Pseudoalteromonas sp. DL-6]QBJ63834.1 hypothetical protein B1F84_12805 [Pseudoalteromonas sp. DL-6]
MKYIIFFTMQLCIMFSSNSQASQTTAASCDYCSAEGKKITALAASFIDGQKIWIIDQQGTDFILDEYKAVYTGNDQMLQVGDFTVEHVSTHSKNSTLSRIVSNTFTVNQEALRNIDKEISHIILPHDDEFQSAFEVSLFPQLFAGKMSDRIMNDPEIKSQFDIIDSQNQELKANLSISIPFLSTSLNLSSQITVSFTDGTTVTMGVELVTTNGTNVKANLKFEQARDKEGNILPIKSSGLSHYRSGVILNSGNTGNMEHFASWFETLQISGIKVITVRGGGANTGSIKDCTYVVTTNAQGKKITELVCS